VRQHLLVVEHASLTPHQATRSLWPTRGLLAGCPGIRAPVIRCGRYHTERSPTPLSCPATARHDQLVDVPRVAWQLRRIVQR